VKLTEAIDIYIKTRYPVGVPRMRPGRENAPKGRQVGFIRDGGAGRSADPGPKEDTVKPRWDPNVEMYRLILPDCTAVCEKTAAACARSYLERLRALRTTIASEVEAEILSRLGDSNERGNEE
jgi:hypothetical protein